MKEFNHLKILNHLDRIEALDEGKKPFPVSCEIDPSNLCNHKCVWCYFAKSRKSIQENIPKKILFNVIKELAEGGTKSITFTGGGEPLANPSTIDAIKLTKGSGIQCGLVTNGGLLSENINKIIIQNCSFVRISLDAGTFETHRQLHKPKNEKNDNFNNIMKNIENLVIERERKHKNITIGVGFLVHKTNYMEIQALAEILKNVNVDYLQIRPINIPGNLDYTKVWNDAQPIIERTMKLSNEKFRIFPVQRRYYEILCDIRNYTKCMIHNLLTVIGADSKVYLCSLFRGIEKYSFGSLKEKSFKEIWNGERRKNIVETLNINKCPNCRYNGYNEILEYLSSKNKIHANFL